MSLNVLSHDMVLRSDCARCTPARPAGVIASPIAAIKSADLNANDPDAAMAQIEGTARSMGIEVVG